MSAKSASLQGQQCQMMGGDAEQDVLRRHATSVNALPQPPSLGRMTTLASWAGQIAQALLQEPVPRRWAHVQGVAARARGLAPVLGTDSDLIEAAAWLHDIGYAPALPSRACINSRRPIPARCPGRRRHGVSAGRASLLRHHRSRRTRTCRRPEPGVRICAVRAVQRADLLRHDDQPGRRARAGRQATRRDTAALRPRAPGEPVNPAGHADGCGDQDSPLWP